MSNYYSEKTYDGPEAIVVSMDIGTTQSGVSFAHFTPGTHPQAQMVGHWPGQTYWTGGTKIPSIVSYRDGVARACGAEALQDFEEDQRNVAHSFKLHVHPAPALISNASSQQFEISPLPPGITIERVYADLMKYLMENTQRFFERINPNGAEIWARLRDTIVIVLAIPNTWDIREQATLRKAAILASLVTEGNAGPLLQFVTESEASLHYVLAQGPSGWLKRHTVFAVIDCGGSTVYTTVYRCVSRDPLGLTETCPSECMQAGGVFVDREVRKMFERKLKSSSFNDPEVIESMVHAFERQVKPKFDGAIEEFTLKFGSTSDNDATVGIFQGRITLSNKALTTVFEPVVDKIVTSCSSLIASQKTEYVLLLGEFGQSPYLQEVLSQRLADCKTELLPVGDGVKKATLEGAIIKQIKQFLVARVARATFGGCVRVLYDKKLHRERKKAAQVYPDGKRRVDGAFHAWIKKGTVLQGTFAYRLPYHVAWEATSTSLREIGLNLKTIGIEVFACESDGIPKWCKDEQGGVPKGMRLICTLNADLSALAGALEVSIGTYGKKFYRVDYEVCFYFGGTQLRANLQWKENGVVREGPVTVMPYVS